MSKRIAILTRYGFSGPYVANKILENKKDLVGIVIESAKNSTCNKAKPEKKKMSFLQKVKAWGISYLVNAVFTKAFRSKYELRHILGWFLERITSRSKERKFFFFRDIVKRYKTPVYLMDDLNSQDSVDLLKNLSPDIIIICGTSILQRHVLETARLAAINIHSSMLPKYRGSKAEFWTIYNNDLDHLGVTIHFATKALDAGDIILQEKVYIEPKDNFTSIRYKTVRVGARKTVEAISLFEEGKVIGIPQDSSCASSFGEPSFEEILRAKTVFRKLKKKVRV